MYTHTLLNKLLAHLYTLYPYGFTYFIRWTKINLNYIIGTFVTLDLQLDKHIQESAIVQMIFLFNENMIYNNTIAILLHHKHKCWLCSTKIQHTAIKQSSVENCLMQSVTSTLLLILFCNQLHITMSTCLILGHVVCRLVTIIT